MTKAQAWHRLLGMNSDYNSDSGDWSDEAIDGWLEGNFGLTACEHLNGDYFGSYHIECDSCGEIVPAKDVSLPEEFAPRCELSEAQR